MKKLLLTGSAFVCVLFFLSCKKDGALSAIACFRPNRIDSLRIKNYDTVLIKTFLSHYTGANFSADSAYLFSKMDSLHNVSTDSISRVYTDTLQRQSADVYFIFVDSSVAVYRQKIYFKYCGLGSDYRAIYTGDPGHIKVDTSNSGTVTGLQTGVNFTGAVTTYNYASTGTYKVTVASTNVNKFAGDIARSEASRVIRIK